jgi:transcriptional regulator with XRE-family HTH domain
MGKRRAHISDQLRKAIEGCGVSRYRIARDLGITESLLSHFMAGRKGLSLRVIDRLCEYLGLELRQSKRKGR